MNLYLQVGFVEVLIFCSLAFMRRLINASNVNASNRSINKETKVGNHGCICTLIRFLHTNF